MRHELEKLQNCLGKLTWAVEKYASNKLSKDDVLEILDEIKEHVLGHKEFFDEYFSVLSSGIENTNVVDKEQFISFEIRILKRYHVNNLTKNEILH